MDRGREPLAAIAKPNAANVALERFQAAYDLAFESGDWSAMGEVYTPEVVFEDRRRMVLVSGGLELLVESLRQRVATGARFQRTRVANAGNRVAIERMFWSGGEPDGRFEIEYLAVGEVNEAGRLSAAILFELDDAPAAQREAWKRWAAIEPELTETLATVSEARGLDAPSSERLERLRAKLADDLIVEDRRRTGMGHIEGGDAYAESLVVLRQLAPNTEIELGWFWPVIGPQGGVFTVRRTGEITGGGDYESDYLALLVHDKGQWKRLEFFELADLDAALARFAELSVPRVEQRIPNAASRARAQVNRCFMAKDWDAMRALASDEMVFEDRRRWSMISGDAEMWVKSSETVQSMSRVAFHDETIATVGERIELRRRVVTGTDPDGGPFESEFLLLTEVDADGKIVASINFDLEAGEAASREAEERRRASAPGHGH